MRTKTLAAAMAVCVAGHAFSALPANAQTFGMAKFDSGCSGDSYFVIRESGWPDKIIRFTLGMGQKIHFQIPRGSTYAMSCGGWPGNNTSWNAVQYE